MSSILRHNARKNGLKLRPDGYVPVADLLRCRSMPMNVSLDQIFGIVENNDKQRFELLQEGNLWLIRARQGHTDKNVKTEELLTPISSNFKDQYNVFNFDSVVHGTQRNVLKLIMENGLCRMARNHIHMAVGLPGEDGVISGMRNGCDTVVEVNLAKTVLGSEIPMWISTNHVVLTAGTGEKGFLPSENFRSVFNPLDSSYLYQSPISFVICLDITLNQGKTLKELEFNEIIEFSAIFIDVKSNQMVDKFRTYVKPSVAKEVHESTIERTGITNEAVFAKSTPNIYRCLQELHKKLLKSGVFSHEFVFVTSGDLEGSQLDREAQVKNYVAPNYFDRWINLRKVFPMEDIPKENAKWCKLNQISKQKQVIKNTDLMLEKLNIGNKDSLSVVNLANVVQHLIGRGFEFK
jgi:2'-phosphotransferase